MKLNKDRLFNIILIILFVTLSIFVGMHHEPWADEAQSWLIARDSSIIQLFTNVLNTEGHPVLWYLILKFFIFIKLPYDKLYLISILFSTLGVSLFIFKSKFNKLIKILFTFSFFIFYQYNIVTRSYCLILFLISLLAIIWEYRHDKLILFILIMSLLMNTSVYCFLFCGSIFFIWILEWYKNKYENKKNHIIAFIILFCLFLVEVLYLIPNKYITANPISKGYSIGYSFFLPLFKIENDYLEFASLLLGFFVSIFIIYLVYKALIGNKKILFYIFIIFAPIISFLFFKYFNAWHLGIVFIIYIFCLWVFKLDHNKILYRFLLFSLICQIPWSIYTCYNDIKYNYTGSKDASEFIKKYDYKNMKIFSSYYYPISINAYFDNNIFYNLDDNIGYFYRNFNSKYYKIFKDYCNIALCKEEFNYYELKYNYKSYINNQLPSVDFFIDNNYDMIVISLTKDFWDDLSGIENYFNKYTFEGNLYFELGIYEKRDYVVLVRKDIDII